jgi:hypothetical protein
MKNPIRHTFAALIAMFAVAGSAHAAFVCDDPPSAVDKRACDAAEQGPEALRHFIQRMRPVHNLYFYDYVNEARLVAWDARDARARAIVEAGETTTASMSKERR